jgi:hypothetical protein
MTELYRRFGAPSNDEKERMMPEVTEALSRPSVPRSSLSYDWGEVQDLIAGWIAALVRIAVVVAVLLAGVYGIVKFVKWAWYQ